MPFGLPGGAGRVEQVEQVLAVHRLRRALVVGVGHQIVVPVVASVGHRGVDVGARRAQPLHHDHVLDGRGGRERDVGRRLERCRLTAPPAAVGRDQDLALGVVDPVGERVSGEAAEDDRVRRADARAGQERDR